MPNQDTPNGLKAVRHYGGGEVRTNDYRIASGLAANIFTGDPVKTIGTGKRITVCAATDAAVGVFQGVFYVAADGTPTFARYWATGTVTSATVDAVALVYDDPNILFEIQASDALVAADIGAVANYAAGAGSTLTGISGFELDSASITVATNTSTMKIIELVPRDDNAYGANARVHVLINKHELASFIRLPV